MMKASICHVGGHVGIFNDAVFVIQLRLSPPVVRMWSVNADFD